MPAKIPTIEAILAQLDAVAATTPLDQDRFYDWREGMARPFIEAKRPRAMSAFDTITALVPPTSQVDPRTGAPGEVVVDAALEGRYRAQIARIHNFLVGLSG